MSKVEEIGGLASALLKQMMSSGLTWDESVAALGLAAGAVADQASKSGDGDLDNCRAHALKRFNEGFDQPVQIVIRAIEPEVSPSAFWRYAKRPH